MKSLLLFGALLLAGFQASASSSYVDWTSEGYCAEFSSRTGAFIQYYDRAVCRNPSYYGMSGRPSHHHTTIVVQRVEFSANLAVELADKVSNIVRALKPYESHSTIGSVLHPLRKSAAYLKAVGMANSPYSGAVRQELINMREQIRSIRTYIDERLEADALEDTITELLFVQAKISSILQ